MKVTHIPSTVSFGGRKYGPFLATRSEPFADVPDSLASALNLPEYMGEVSLEDETDPQVLKERITALEAERAELARELEAVRALKGPSEAQQGVGSTPTLPPDAKARLVALPRVGETLADTIIAALTAPTKTE